MSILEQIKEGMKAVDRNEDEVGTVKYVQMTDEIPADLGPETATPSNVRPLYNNTFVDEVADVIADETDLPRELRQRLMREGFIRIDAGILGSDRFALPHQVDRVSDDKVYLKVAGDELIVPQ